MEELSLRESYLISFTWFHCKDCFKDFLGIKYTYVACFKVAVWLVFTFCGSIVFMVKHLRLSLLGK